MASEAKRLKLRLKSKKQAKSSSSSSSTNVRSEKVEVAETTSKKSDRSDPTVGRSHAVASTTKDSSSSDSIVIDLTQDGVTGLTAPESESDRRFVEEETCVDESLKKLRLRIQKISSTFTDKGTIKPLPSFAVPTIDVRPEHEQSSHSVCGVTFKWRPLPPVCVPCSMRSYKTDPFSNPTDTAEDMEVVNDNETHKHGINQGLTKRPYSATKSHNKSHKNTRQIQSDKINENQVTGNSSDLLPVKIDPKTTTSPDFLDVRNIPENPVNPHQESEKRSRSNKTEVVASRVLQTHEERDSAQGVEIPSESPSDLEDACNEVDSSAKKLECCPLCQTIFHSGMQQIDKDGHIAECFAASEDDATW